MWNKKAITEKSFAEGAIEIVDKNALRWSVRRIVSDPRVPQSTAYEANASKVLGNSIKQRFPFLADLNKWFSLYGVKWRKPTW